MHRCVVGGVDVEGPGEDVEGLGVGRLHHEPALRPQLLAGEDDELAHALGRQVLDDLQQHDGSQRPVRGASEDLEAVTGDHVEAACPAPGGQITV